MGVFFKEIVTIPKKLPAGYGLLDAEIGGKFPDFGKYLWSAVKNQS